MGTKIKIWLLYLLRDIKEKIVLKEYYKDHNHGGILIVTQTYTVIEKPIGFLFWPILKQEVNVFWKPFKIYISEEALPSIIENNRKNKACDLVNVWFELTSKFEIFSLNEITLKRKIKFEDVLTEILNNLIKNAKAQKDDK